MLLLDMDTYVSGALYSLLSHTGCWATLSHDVKMKANKLIIMEQCCFDTEGIV
jgi:hypothetical protein